MQPTPTLDQVLTEMEEVRATVLAELHGCHDEAARQKPRPESWSLTEIAHHLALSETSIVRLLRKLMRESLRQASPSPEDLAAERARVRAIALNRAEKAQAPDRTVPPDSPSTLTEALQMLTTSRNALREFIASTSLEELACVSAPHPLRGFGTLTGQGWLTIIDAHDRRHIEQIREVKAALAKEANA